MIPYLTIALAICALFATGYMNFVRPARKARQTEEPSLPPGFVPPSAALKPPEPKAPRDTSRPYPRPKGSRSKLNRVCPVCGTDDHTGSLDGRLFGWPAHRSCAEWLGDWKPPQVPPQQVAELQKALDDIKDRKVIVLPPGKPVPPEQQTCDGCGAALGTGVRYHDQAGHHYCPACDRKGFGRTQKMASNGLISVNEARERLNREIVAAWGVPPALLTEHTHKAGDPLPIERCPECGAQFCGTPDYLRSAYKTHRQLGCRQS